MARKASAKGKLRGRRDFLGDTVPLLVGRNPNRVAPAHITKGFIGSAVGSRRDLGPLRRLIRQNQNDPALVSVSSTILMNDVRRRRLGESLRVVLDPDRRVFNTSGSFFPLHAGFIDEVRGMDDGFGRDIWNLVNAFTPAAAVVIAELLYPRDATDGLTALAMALTTGFENEDFTIAAQPWPWAARGASKLAKRFGEALSTLVCNASVLETDRIRSARLASLSRGVAAAAFLGSLRAPSLIAPGVNSWTDLSPMFAFGGVPPGAARSLSVRP
jgi:hypothetical protein